jgi:alpha/beta superfamily hydrolase
VGLQQAGFAVLAYDYRGYGTSEGIPSEAGAYKDIEAAYTYLVAQGILRSRFWFMGARWGVGHRFIWQPKSRWGA